MSRGTNHVCLLKIIRRFLNRSMEEKIDIYDIIRFINKGLIICTAEVCALWSIVKYIFRIYDVIILNVVLMMAHCDVTKSSYYEQTH